MMRKDFGHGDCDGDDVHHHHNNDDDIDDDNFLRYVLRFAAPHL